MNESLAPLSRPADPSNNSTPILPKHSRLWPIAAVLITGLLVVGAPLSYVFVRWNSLAMAAPQKITDAVLSAFHDFARPQINVREIVASSIGDLHKQQKLVVLKTNISADVTRDESAQSWGMYWGTNTARVMVKNAHVQYYIDLMTTGTANYSFDESSRTLTVRLPRPRLDTEFVGIDPTQISTLDLRGGWARFDKSETRDNAIAELRPTVIIQASSPLVKKEAEEAGKQAITNLLTPLAQTLSKDGVKFRITYDGEI